jgi:N-acetyl-gamma-glutamyl-phosphate reductase
MINVGIIGATGYTAEELISILLKHPNVRLTYLAAKIERPLPICEIFPRFKGYLESICELPDVDKAISKCDLFFLALPHTVSLQWVPRLLKAGRRVVDLSADYRLSNVKDYQHYYGHKHKDKQGLKNSVYGLPELYRAKIKNTSLVANPGCYPTAAILALTPLIACDVISDEKIIIDAKSGLSGAGRKLLEGLLFSEINGNFRSYKINTHQHIPEIEQELSNLASRKINVNFVPHLLPVNRGIWETIYINTKHRAPSAKQLTGLYKKFYKKEPFVRIRSENSLPQLKDVVGTNFCDIAIKVFPEKGMIVIVSVIDNLLKGASGQAVQNMNIMYGFKETEALL